MIAAIGRANGTRGMACVLAAGAAYLLAVIAAHAAERPGSETVVSTPAAQPASGPGARPTGLVAVIQNSPGEALNQATIDNPYISGVALQIHWSDIEPEQGKPDWSRLDALVASAAAAQKWVQFLIFPGFFTPSWALAGVKTDHFPLQYGPGRGKVETLPMPWDNTYLDRWLAFVRAVSEGYGQNPALKVVAVDGPTSVSAEYTLPNSIQDIKQWQADGYTPTKYLNAWKRVLTAYAADFQNQYLSVSLGAGLAIDNAGKFDKANHDQIRAEVANQASQILGSRFVFQDSSLDGISGLDKQGGMAVISSWIGRAVTGYQMGSSAAAKGMGDPGDAPPVVLRKALDKGMAPVKGGRVDYIEVYEPDILAADLQPVLKYGASLFEPTRPGVPRAPLR